MRKAIIIIQCRYDSKRFPGKILQPLGRYTCLEYLIKRLELANCQVMVATTNRIEDEVVVTECNKLKRLYKNFIGSYAGDYRDIAKRLYNASKGYDHIVRITGDDLFVQADKINSFLNYLNSIKKTKSYYYTKDIIRGFDFDVIKRDTLEKIIKEQDTSKIESIEFLFRKGRFTSEPIKSIQQHKRNDISLTLDDQDDYKLIDILFHKLYPLNNLFTIDIVIDYLDKNPHLKEINKKPRLTVYTVFKDYPIHWLKKAIDSLQMQDYKDYEYILVDYGSKKLHKFIKDKVNDVNIITYLIDDMNFIEATNYAIQKASGRYVMRLDADDFLCSKDSLSKMMDFVENNDKYSMIVPNFHEIPEEYVEGLAINECNVDGQLLNLPTCAIIEKRIYQYVNFLDKQHFRDGTAIEKAFDKYDFKIGYIKEPLFYYRIHNKSLTHGKYSKKEIKEMDAKING